MGQHALSAKAWDAGVQLARIGRYLLQELISVSGRVLAERASSGTGAVAAAGSGQERRLSEALGRMQVAEEERRALEAALLPWRGAAGGE